MRHLFIARHADYTGKSDEDATRQAERLAEDMKAITGELRDGHYIISSTKPRAMKTAEVIARAFGLSSFENDRRLSYYEGRSEKELKDVDAMIAPYKDANGVVTIVMHYELCGTYPRHVLKTLFERDEKIRCPNHGQGIHFDVEARTYQHVPRAQP